MKKLLATLAAAALLASTGLASAAESQGKVKSVDESKMEMTLEDGTVYQLGAEVMIKELQPGQEVTVSYETKDGKNHADKVTAK